MVASNDTIREVVEVLHRHLEPEQIRGIVADLQEVRGNESFEQTIDLLEQAVR